LVRPTSADRAATGPPIPEPGATDRIAPVWHTIVLAIILIFFSIASASSQHRFAMRHGRAVLYIATIAWEWLIVGFIAWGTRRKIHFRDLAGRRWRSVEDVFADAAVGVGFWIMALFVLGVIGNVLGLAEANHLTETKQKLGFLVPHGLLELTLFIALSATAGFCEEIIFRAYFQRQFAALFHSITAGLLLQAILFGAGHAYEGGKRMILITIYGAMFGMLAQARRSLRPGMFAHFLHDASAGIALRHLLQ
jgi:membrane protease YdiL (CAAX protease family)